MNVLFLDHYGIMCLSNKEIIREKTSLPTYSELKGHNKFEDFDKDAVKILNRILEETNSEIVISSDWRFGVSLDYMGDFYIKQGVIKRPIGFTPIIRFNGLSIQENRKLEILNWLQNNEVENWVVVDDLYIDVTNLAWAKYPNKGIKENNIVNIIYDHLKCQHI